MPYSPQQLIEAFIHAGELSDALDVLNAALTENPQDDTLRRLRVQVYLRKNSPQSDHAALNDLAQMALTSADHYTHSVLLERTEPTLTPALDAIQRAYDSAPDDNLRSRSLERKLDLLRKHGDLPQALALAISQGWLQWAADAAAELDDTALAIDYYTRTLEGLPKLYEVITPSIVANIEARVRLKRAAAYQQRGDYARAEEDYAAAQAHIPNDPMIAFNRAVLLWRAGNPLADALALMLPAYQSAPPLLQKLMRDELAATPALAPLHSALPSV